MRKSLVIKKKAALRQPKLSMNNNSNITLLSDYFLDIIFIPKIEKKMQEIASIGLRF